MVNHRNLILLAVAAFILIFSIASTQAKQPVNPGKPGLAECQAKVNELEQTIADQQATIGALQQQIDTLQTLLDGYENYAPLAKTGQTTATYQFRELYDDGYYQKGLEPPVPRFTDNGDGTVTDHLTRLVWLKNANCFGLHEFHIASPMPHDLESGNCGLLDGSVKGDWRLPNRNEMLSMIDIEIEIDAPHIAGLGYFTNLMMNTSENYYWTSSTCQYNYPAVAYYVNLYDGTSGFSAKAIGLYRIWPVRDPK